MIGSTFLKLLPTAHLHLRRDLSPETSKNTYPVTASSHLKMLFFGKTTILSFWVSSFGPFSGAIAVSLRRVVPYSN